MQNRHPLDKVFRQGHQLGEDFSFCRKARLAGLEVWADPSFEVQHLGDYGYSRVDWIAQRREPVRQAVEHAEG